MYNILEKRAFLKLCVSVIRGVIREVCDYLFMVFSNSAYAYPTQYLAWQRGGPYIVW